MTDVEEPGRAADEGWTPERARRRGRRRRPTLAVAAPSSRPSRSVSTCGSSASRDPRRRQRRPAGRRRPDPDLDHLPVAELELPHRREPREPARSRARCTCCSAMGEVFALLLGEIDLSIGFVTGIGGVVTAELVKQPVRLAVVGGDPRRAARVAPLSALLQGTLITRLGLPSFVVTLAGLLGLQGVMLLILGAGRRAPDQRRRRQRLRERQPDPRGQLDRDDRDRRRVRRCDHSAHESRRRSSGLVAPPVSLTVLKIAASRSPASCWC